MASTIVGTEWKSVQLRDRAGGAQSEDTGDAGRGGDEVNHVVLEILERIIDLDVTVDLGGERGELPARQARLTQRAPDGLFDELGRDVPGVAELALEVNVLETDDVGIDGLAAKLFADCIREGATNAVKHAHATHVMVTCDDFSLTIEDDGTSSVETVEEGTGLGNMRRAVEAAGGTLVVDPNPFTLRISLG